ncbi:MAG: hypothetical protein A3D74_05555 [Candidatus Levybacteria bacterium RIFCSPHIGHO2_02_FULL_37_13]|nr:MAG: hypothetical protein A3D74_05555 [Candidatus Levybacteria bacterium RIFCSPHIGHO2_02_FULL_37_13]OGH29121.1 MAG: hypothetical protein A3E40_03175 [Candidatus Levybacteria bacterium RIFCSPHIGHO2_12_FULL_37_9]OGH40410.1 MAG: hypothetical protein A3B41_02780 [Candidatus Levybacteria bacterium RIFCSPLOWO2_01_FULL_37_26]
MICPKCEEGKVGKVKFKKSGTTGYLCDFCESLWFNSDDINIGTGHTLSSFAEGGDREYSLESTGEKDQEHEPAKYKNHK